LALQDFFVIEHVFACFFRAAL